MAVTNAYSGAMPWHKQQRREDARKGYQYKVGYEKDKKGRDYATGGWTVIQPGEWSANTPSSDKRTQKPTMMEMRMYHGRKAYVPVGDAEKFAAFYRMDFKELPEQMAAYAEASFSEEQAEKGKVFGFHVEEGHIQAMDYNSDYQTMQVTFRSDGAVVLFFRVPYELYVEFERYAKSNASITEPNGTVRHLIGIRFWDLVRVRGSRIGSRFQFSYTSGGEKYSYGSGNVMTDTATLRAEAAARTEQRINAAREATVELSEQPSPVKRAKQEADDLVDKAGRVFPSPAEKQQAKFVAKKLNEKYAAAAENKEEREKWSKIYDDFYLGLTRWGNNRDINAMLNFAKSHHIFG